MSTFMRSASSQDFCVEGKDEFLGRMAVPWVIVSNIHTSDRKCRVGNVEVASARHKVARY